MTSTDPPRTRDAERSRTNILDAAERLFAAQGYRGTSLQDIGDAASVSRGTPSYFFGSKEGLYRAVMRRKFAEVGRVIRDVQRDAAARGTRPDEVIAREIEGYIDFLTAHPALVRLMQWEALDGGEVLGELEEYAAAPREALAVIRAEVARDGFRPVDPLHLFLSIAAMCWYPLSQKDTLLRTLGHDPFDPAFREQRKRHIVDLVMNGIRER